MDLSAQTCPFDLISWKASSSPPDAEIRNLFSLLTELFLHVLKLNVVLLFYFIQSGQCCDLQFFFYFKAHRVAGPHSDYHSGSAL